MVTVATIARMEVRVSESVHDCAACSCMAVVLCLSCAKRMMMWLRTVYGSPANVYHQCLLVECAVHRLYRLQRVTQDLLLL